MAESSASCPECGAAVRPEQEWCTLCLHVLRAPEPEPVYVPVSMPSSVPAAPVHVPDGSPYAQTTTTQSVPQPAGTPGAPTSPAPAGGSPLTPEAAAAAEALLAQLAVEARRDRLSVPSYLDSKAKVAVAVTVAMTGLIVLALVGMTIFGAIVG